MFPFESPGHGRSVPFSPRGFACLLAPLLVAAIAALAGAASGMEHPAAAELKQGLGSGPSSHMHMKFDVTFMGIDIARLDVWLAGGDAARVDALVRGAKKPKDARDAIADAVMAGEGPWMLTMTYLRDSDYERFARGIRKGIEVAVEAGAIGQVDGARLLATQETDTRPIRERGVRKGDMLAYRIDATSVRTVYIGAEGEVLIDAHHTDDAFGRYLRTSWFTAKSRFRDGLVASLFKDGN